MAEKKMYIPQELHDYVHVLWSGDSFFNDRIINLVTLTEDLNPDRHIFITNRLEIYDNHKYNPRVIYMPEQKGASLINKAFSLGYWVFVHGMCSASEVLKINRKGINRIIWRTWGHDIRLYNYKKGEFLKNVIKKYLNNKYLSIGNHFCYIGGNNEIDELAIKKIFKKTRYVRIPYPDSSSFDIIKNVRIRMLENQEHGRKKIRILIGHSGIPSDNHFFVLNHIKEQAFISNVELVFVLSYGDENYINELENYINNTVKDSSVIIRNKMSFEQYNELLANIDIAVLYGTGSYALDNISSLLYFEKSFILNPDGIIAKAFSLYGLKYNTIYELNDVIYNYNNAVNGIEAFSNTSLGPQTYENDIRTWVGLLNELHDGIPSGES